MVIRKLIDQAGVVVTHLVMRRMESDRALPQPKGGTLRPPQGATDQRLPSQGVIGQAVRKHLLSRSTTELLVAKRLPTSKMDMGVMKLTVTTPTSRRRRIITDEEERINQLRQGSHQNTPTSIMAKNTLHLVGLPKRLGVRCLIG